MASRVQHPLKFLSAAFRVKPNTTRVILRPGYYSFRKCDQQLELLKSFNRSAF